MEFSESIGMNKGSETQAVVLSEPVLKITSVLPEVLKKRPAYQNLGAVMTRQLTPKPRRQSESVLSRSSTRTSCRNQILLDVDLYYNVKAYRKLFSFNVCGASRHLRIRK